ncbi:Hpt domain-containing protein [Fuscovulum ytuae]|uniref:Hpt domain-containing protein n=1 Tax=Fuscovulum ytuae TaxID=3042299 RepID=A0ABY8QC76_9RHOB|nr:Hpt domain-containing protein [Fuscovulum sp. YMD61]WGV18318.1 Hpt domain-containing protein [Fuscovulum sp. YMD61]
MLIDVDVVEEVRETLGDDTFNAFVRRMLDEVAETQAALLRLLRERDFETLARTAHRTSGSAASIGAKGLHAALKEIENVARSEAAAQRLPDLIAAVPARARETADALSSVVTG